MMRQTFFRWLLVAAILAFLIISCHSAASEPHHDRTEIADEIQIELDELIEVWYPRVIDQEYGGYLSRFSHDWEIESSQDKMIVTQARHLWTLSKMGEKYPENQSYAEYASHGFDFLADKMWDETYGGFYQLVTREGEPIAGDDGNLNKTLYGNAFALYGLSAYYGYSETPAALELAKKTFHWLETHSHDPVHRGYFQPLSREGIPDTTGTPKDYNSGIHILEALTELYTVWPEPIVKERLEEMFYIVRDTMVTDRGYLKLYFEPDWTHLSYSDSSKAAIMENISVDHVTPGHDIETAYLLLEAAHVLGMDNDQSTHQIAKKLTDHTLETGWDENTGGFYDIGILATTFRAMII